jgi:hypothetical protein
MLRNVVVSTAVALFVASFVATAHAQEKAERPCAADAKKFCGNVQPGEGRIAKCMKSHEAELSPVCQERMKAAAARAEQVRQECKADAEKFCKGVKPRDGRILACLKSHQAELAPACAAEFNRKK